MPTTVVLVACALKGRNGTRLNVIFSTVRSTTFEMPLLHLFANWNIFGSGHALLLQSFLFQNAILKA